MDHTREAVMRRHPTSQTLPGIDNDAPLSDEENLERVRQVKQELAQRRLHREARAV